MDKGIRVNCVAPGPVWTPLNVADKPAKEAGKHGSQVPMGRPAQPEEIAPAFVFLASTGGFVVHHGGGADAAGWGDGWGVSGGERGEAGSRGKEGTGVRGEG